MGDTESVDVMVAVGDAVDVRESLEDALRLSVGVHVSVAEDELVTDCVRVTDIDEEPE